jgi:hypothetical protein
MTPEERKGLEEILAECGPEGPAVAWLKRQLAHADWDDSIEKMGGGKKARDAYMKPIFDTSCSVTAFDMHAQLTGDGRERGLWIWLLDESKARAEIYDKWAEGALEEFCTLAGIDEKTTAKFRLSMAMDSFKRVANSKVHEAALLEWPAVKKMYAIIGKELAKQEPKPKTTKPKKTKKRPATKKEIRA